MAPWKSGILAVALVAGLAGPARSQFVAGGARAGGFTANPTFGGATVYSANGLGNYAAPGSYTGFGGYGTSGFGFNQGGYYAPTQPVFVPQTYNNMGGLMDSIRTQTGRGNSFGLGPIGGTTRRRIR